MGVIVMLEHNILKHSSIFNISKIYGSHVHNPLRYLSSPTSGIWEYKKRSMVCCGSQCAMLTAKLNSKKTIGWSTGFSSCCVQCLATWARGCA